MEGQRRRAILESCDAPPPLQEEAKRAKMDGKEGEEEEEGGDVEVIDVLGMGKQ